MSPRRIVVAAGLLAVAICGPAAVLIAAPGAPAPMGLGGDEEFRLAGDGTLPQERPALREHGAPLSSAERGYAIRLALQTLPDSARDVLDAPGGEVLAADLPGGRDPDDGRRLVQVSLYDYRADRLQQVLVDLTADRVTEDRTVSGLQLPPSAAETEVAFDLALKAWPALPFLHEFLTSTDAPLLTMEQVHVVAGAWLPGGDVGDAQLVDATGCGPDRCLQLLVALPSGHYLDTGDFVVDLSTRTVLDLADGGTHGP